MDERELAGIKETGQPSLGHASKAWRVLLMTITCKRIPHNDMSGGERGAVGKKRGKERPMCV